MRVYIIISTALKLCSHAPHFSCLCSVFFHVHRGTYAPIGVGQIIIIMIIYIINNARIYYYCLYFFRITNKVPSTSTTI